MSFHYLTIRSNNVGKELELAGFHELSNCELRGQSRVTEASSFPKKTSTDELLSEAVEVRALQDALEQPTLDLLVGQTRGEELLDVARQR